MFEAITQLSSFSKLTPLTRSTLFRIHRCFVTRSNLFKAFNRPAGSHTLGRRFSHPVPPQYYEGKKVEERLTTFPNPALYSHQLCFKTMTDPPHPMKCCSPSNHCPVPHRRYYQVPYAGPPTYDTIAKRFSHQPSPVLYYEAKRANDAIRRGEYVDVHDVGGLNPKDYDVVLTDVNYNILRGEISVLGGIPYLQKATKTEAETVVEEGKAMVFGPHLRMIFPAVVSTEGSAYWIYFIVDTGSPLTYLSTQAAKLLDIPNDGSGVAIAGYSQPVYFSPTSSHFSDINLLGSDFLMSKGVTLSPDVRRKFVTLYFLSESKWNPPTKR